MVKLTPMCNAIHPVCCVLLCCAALRLSVARKGLAIEPTWVDPVLPGRRRETLPGERDHYNTNLTREALLAVSIQLPRAIGRDLSS